MNQVTSILRHTSKGMQIGRIQVLIVMLAAIAAIGLVGCGGTPPAASPTATLPAPTVITDAEPTQETSDSWKTFTSEEGRFSILVPAEPKEDTQVTDTQVGEITMNMFVVSGNGPEYTAMYSDYPESAVGDPEEMLQGAIDGIAKNATLVSQNKTTVAGNPAIEAEFEAEGVNYVWYKTVMVENRIYQLIVATSTAGKDLHANDARKFIDSFELKGE